MKDRVMLFLLFAFVLFGLGMLARHLATSAVESAAEVMASKGLP